MVFSALFGNFRYGIRASFGDNSNSLFLYNNTVADYYEYGIEVGDPFPNTQLALHNNVVVNHPDAASEPYAYHSAVDDGVTLATSHNTCFSSLANAEVIAVGQRISGLGGLGWRRLPRADAAASFATIVWDIANSFAPEGNRNFYRLDSDGLLHDEDFDHGVTVTEGSPNLIDHAVVDDWERDARPSGTALHTDRGADQVELGVTAVHDPLDAAMALAIRPSANPAREGRLRFAAGVAGDLAVEVFDMVGRRVHHEARPVAAGVTGEVAWRPGASGVFAYRATLTTRSGQVVSGQGRFVVLR
jgi:hypothetical protein